MERLLYEIRYGLRQLSRSPGFAAAAVLILGLGIGATTAVFSVVDNILFRPLSLPGSERILTLCEAHEGKSDFCSASPPNVADWAAGSRTLEAAGVARARGVEIRQGDRRTEIPGAMATPGFLRALGVQPLHGRLLNEEDMLPGGSGSVMVLSYETWQNEFGGDPGLVGRTVLVSSGGDGRVLKDEPVTVIGILPEAIEVPRLEWVRAWIPLQFGPRDEQYRGWRGFVAMGRLAEGATLGAAVGELNRIEATLAETYPEDVRNWSVEAIRLRDWVVKDQKPLLLLFLAAVGLVLAIACVNLMSLLLARATERERELTVRAALGASRPRLVTQLLVEGALLAVLGGGLGVLLSVWLVDAFLALAPGGIPRMAEVKVDGRILAFSLAVTALTGLLVGLAPAARVRTLRLQESLKLGRTLTGDRRGSRLRGALVVSQLALALTLVLSAGLLLRSFGRLVAFDPGFELDGLLTFQVYPPMWRYDSAERRADFYTRAEQELRAIPGVTAVGTTSAGPLFGGGDGNTPFLVRGRPEVPVQDAPTVQWYNAGPGYFPTLGVPVVLGRNLSEEDRSAGTPAALVNQTMAARHWPGASPIGARLNLPDWSTEAEIVGVVPDLTMSERSGPPEPAIYVSDRQRPRGASYFVVRTAGDPAAVVPAIRRTMLGLDPEVEPRSVLTMEELLGKELVGPRFNVLLVGLFAVIALVLSAAGLYAVIAYTVTTRRREFGIRMALGAQRARVLRSVLVDGGILFGAGLLLGLAGALVFTRLLRSVIHEIAPTDPLAIAGAVLMLALTAGIATLAPAVRASRTEPATVLRQE